MHLLERRHPFFIARTGSCAEPIPFPSLWSNLVVLIFAGCYRPLLALPDVISASLSQDAWAPPRRSAGCSYLLLRLQHRPSPKEHRSAYREIPLKRLHSGGYFRGCSHFVMFRPLSLLATLVAPTTAVSGRAVCDFYGRARHASLPPQASDMLAVRNRQLTARGLSPRQTHSLVGCSAL